MKKNEVRDAVFSRLNAILKDKGFTSNKLREFIGRETPVGWQRLSVGIADYNPKFLIALTVSMRADRIAAINNLFAGVRPEDFGETGTTLTGLGYFINKPSFEFVVWTPEDVDAAMRDLEEIIVQKILPFLDQFSRIEHFERLINGRDVGFEHGRYPAKARNGIIAAYLANPSEFESIIEKYMQELQKLKFNETDFSRVKELVAHLREQRKAAAVA